MNWQEGPSPGEGSLSDHSPRHPDFAFWPRRGESTRLSVSGSLQSSEQQLQEELTLLLLLGL